MENRFYPFQVAKFENEPITEDFEMVENELYGKGIISKRNFKKGDLLFRFSGEILSHQTLFTLQINEGIFIEDPYFMGRILHSCEPSAIVDMKKLEFWATKEINIGEYITMDYETTEDQLFQEFHCLCNSENCRKMIRGKKPQKNAISS